MAIEYTWKIDAMDRDTSTGGVKTVHWRCNATDGEHTATAYGAVSFTFDPDAPDFVPYASLKEDFVLHWVWHTDEANKDLIQAGLAAQIDQLINPVTATGVPW